MKDTVLRILFRHDRAYLTENKFLTLDHLHISSSPKSFKKFAYWTIKVINYREEDKKIYCEILSYDIGEIDFSEEQLQLAEKLNIVEDVWFDDISTSGLMFTKERPFRRPDTTKSLHSDEELKLSLKKEPIIVKINESFLVPLKDVRFMDGGVSFTKKFKDYENVLELSITNHNIKEEFEVVKKYFINVLITKKINVNVKINIQDHEVNILEISSLEIDKIDNRLIDDIKIQVDKSMLRKRHNLETQKIIFNMEEFYETFSKEKIKASTFYSNETAFLEDLLNISNSKHAQHLTYLSGKHCFSEMKLKFIYKPFSFIFLLDGLQNYYFVWETLKTQEATYIWSIPKDKYLLDQNLKKIEDTIQLIQDQTKRDYINSTEDEFERIFHDYKDVKNGFANWKSEMVKILK
jgi:hypothetical protein